MSKQRTTTLAATLAVLVTSAALRAGAQQAEPAPAPPAAPVAPTSNAAPAPAPTALASSPAPPSPANDAAAQNARIEELERKNRELVERLEALEEEQAWTNQRVDQALPLAGRITGYVDFGFFRVAGDGRGIRTDIGHEALPEYEGVVPDSWVFLGDPLATAVNSRGEPADVAESRAITFDPIGNAGKPTFILNTLSFNVFAGIGDDVTVNAAVDFMPRSRNVSDPDGIGLGDYLDVKLGYVEYRLNVAGTRLSLSAGKFDSVVGYEYRVQEAPTRISVTPSLICRYICGHPLGLKARWELADDALALNVALTNGSHFTESFDFADEIDVNAGKTVAGRLSYRFPVGAGLEVGASGAYGTQDAQVEEDVAQWHYGFDAHLEAGDANFTAEFVQGKAEGDDLPNEPPCSGAPCLEYLGGYGLFGYRVTGWVMPYVRGDFRKALHTSGASFVYYSKLMRVTGGLRFDLGTSVIVKAEYTNIRELDPVPAFPDDVFTSSLVAKW